MWIQQGIDDLKRRLLCTTIELESFKMEAKDEIRKSEEILANLFDLLKVVQKERDEARDQLQKLLIKVMPNNAFPQTQPEIPILLPAMVNSSMAESNSLSVSETYNNHQSHSSSPVDSFFDSVNSPELSNINVVDSNKICFANKTNEASALFKNITKGKVLPQKGKLLQTVMEAGPLLQTLLVAGPLPRWRNPPKMKPFNIPPPFSVKGCETTTSNCYMSPKPLSSLGHTEMSYSPGFPQTCSSSLLNFAGNPPNSSLNSTTRLLGSSYVNSSIINSQIPLDKRRRLQ